MSTKEITTSLFATLMKSPFAVLTILGFGFWQATMMSPEQLRTMEELMRILNNPFGWGILFIIAMCVIYAMVHPGFAFLGKELSDYLESQTTIQALMREHFDASKHMSSELQEIKIGLSERIPERLNAIEHYFKK